MRKVFHNLETHLASMTVQEREVYLSSDEYAEWCEEQWSSEHEDFWSGDIEVEE